MNVDQVLDLVVDASERGHVGLRRPANALLEAMAVWPWWVSAGRHRGGRSDSKRPPDFNDHITVVVRVGYHLRVTLDGHIRDIVRVVDDPERIPPWLPPGAAV
jgi:hypothetical protein